MSGAQFSGSGPGARAPDGCSVDFYASLPYLGELDSVRPLLAPDTAVLELGAGAGRLTRSLLEWGLRVTAVDNSPEMLERLPPGVARVQCDIEMLHLDCVFDTVLLAGCLINHPAPAARAGLLAASRRHLAPHGQLLLERHDPQWLRNAPVGLVRKLPELNYSCWVDAVHQGADATAMTLRYELRGQAWSHSFCVAALSDPEVEESLEQAGLRLSGWFGSTRRWARATIA